MADLPGIAPALATLVGILQRDKARGRETVPLSPEGAEVLRGLPGRLRRIRAGVAPVAAAAVDSDRPAPAAAAPAPGPASPPASVKLPDPAVPAAPGGVPDETRRRELLNEIFHRVKRATEPRALGTLRETLVFATGNPCAEIAFVGEAPGAEEENQKKPFVGPAGQKLDQILKAMGLSRGQVYISNIVKFRPKMGDGRFQGTNNRPPNEVEMATCLPFIRAELEVVRPRVIVALGRTAAEGLLERGGSIASFRGKAHEFAGMPVVVTYHPSYLLRQEKASDGGDREAKRAVWEDMLRAMELAGMPVSDKQRGFFR